MRLTRDNGITRGTTRDGGAGHRRARSQAKPTARRWRLACALLAAVMTGALGLATASARPLTPSAPHASARPLTPSAPHVSARPLTPPAPRTSTQPHRSAAESRRRPAIYWGAVIGSQFTGVPAPYQMQPVTDFASRDAAGKAPSIVPMYQAFEDCSATPCVPYAFPTSEFKNIRSYGAIPMVSWGSSSSQDGENDVASDRHFTLKAIIDGKFNSLITAWATEAKAFGHPFFLRFDWEMNGNWFVWGNATNANTAREYVAAWRHVHNIFTRVGATNATWVWCPNNGNAKGSIANLASFYPGNAYVNWTCTDVYSYGKHSGRSAGSWNALAGPTYQAISRLAPHKPMMVGEFNAASAGGSQPSWLSSVLAEIPNAYPKIHAVILFDTFRQWELEDHPASVTAFAKGIRRAVYAPNHFAGLTGGPIKAL